MTRCQHCGAWNAEDEHHCGMCGREPSGQAPARPRRAAPNALPAQALPPPPPREGRRPPGPARRAPPAGKLIPFESIAPDRVPPPEPTPERRPSVPRSAPRASGPRPQLPTRQASLPLAAPGAQPTPAAWREAPPASLRLRFAAAAVDSTLVALGLACVLATFHLMGGRAAASPRALLPWLGVILALWLFYRTLWCVLRADSLGMHRLRLRLINFDGYEPEPAQRWVRLGAACLSVAAGGLGLLWALVDEEHLTWHDHISKTFPTLEPAAPRRTR